MQPVSRVDRYLLREMAVPFLIGQGAVVVMLTGTVLYNNAETFLNYHIPAAAIGKIAVLFLPYLVNLTMPVATAIAASLAVSRLARDSEITVMRGAGLSLKRVFRWIFIVGFLLSLFDIALGEMIVPWANARYERTLTDLSRTIRFLAPQAEVPAQSPDRRVTVHVGRMELMERGAKMSDVTLILQGNRPGARTIVLARDADYDEGKWVLHNARIHEYAENGFRERYTESPRMEVDFRLSERLFNLIALQLPLYSPDSARMGIRELASRVWDQRRYGVNQRDLLELHFKLSVPFSCLVFALVCPPMSLRFARAGSFMGVLLSIVLVFVYWNTLLAARIVGATYPEVVPPAVAGWGQNVVFSVLGLFALWRGE